MKLKITKTKKTSILYVQKAYRDKNGKSTSKIHERLGTLEEVRQRCGDRDPIEWAKEYIAGLTAQEKEGRQVIISRLSPTKLIEKGAAQSCEGGYLFLKRLYHKVGMDRICEAISRKHKFDFDLNKVLELMVYERLLRPASKPGNYRRCGSYIEPFDIEKQHIYRSLDVLDRHGEYIQKRLFLNSSRVVERDTTVMYYDCTNYFFERESSDPDYVTDKKGNVHERIRKYGVSKEHRPNPIVQMGMFIDNSGMPVAMCINPGNTNEQTTLIPTEKIIVEKMGVSKIVVCTDGGLSSEGNRSYNSTAERSFITVQSIKKLEDHLKDWCLEPSGWKLVKSDAVLKEKRYRDADEDEMEFDLTDADTAHYYGDRTFYRERWIVNDITKFSQRLIVTFSYKYRDYLRFLRQREIDKADSNARNNRTSTKSYKSPDRFLSETYATEDGEVAAFRTVALNLDAISEEEKYDGFYAICTDLSDDVPKIFELNHNRWESEDAFRIIKTDFKGRPVFVWTAEHIRAHFIVCFITLLLFRIMEKELDYKYTSSAIIEKLRSMTMNIVKGEGYKPNFTRDDLTDDLHAKAGFRLDTEIVTRQRIKQIIANIKNVN